MARTKHTSTLSRSEQLADTVANTIGSWKFITIQSIFIVSWVSLNLIHYLKHWGAYPFVFLNLFFSTQAAYSGPIIMMAQNRQNERDRHQALANYQTNLAAKEEIEQLQKVLARIEIEKLNKIIAILQQSKSRPHL